MDEAKETKDAKESSLPGLALIGLYLTGIIGLGVSVGALCAHDFSATAFSLIASAIAFGAIAKVSFR